MGSNNDISLKALAKINLGLDVVRRREDGYHEVRMIMQTIQLYDRLDIKRTQEPGIQIQTNLSFLPVNETNLIYKAATAYGKRCADRCGCTILYYERHGAGRGHRRGA